MKIERFEDIKAWQEGRVLVRMAHAPVGSHCVLADHTSRGQTHGVAVSVMSNKELK